MEEASGEFARLNRNLTKALDKIVRIRHDLEKALGKRRKMASAIESSEFACIESPEVEEAIAVINQNLAAVEGKIVQLRQDLGKAHAEPRRKTATAIESAQNQGNPMSVNLNEDFIRSMSEKSQKADSEAIKEVTSKKEIKVYDICSLLEEGGGGIDPEDLVDVDEEEMLDRVVQEQALRKFLDKEFVRDFFENIRHVEKTPKNKAEVKRVGRNVWNSMPASDKEKYIREVDEPFTQLRKRMRAHSTRS